MAKQPQGKKYRASAAVMIGGKHRAAGDIVELGDPQREHLERQGITLEPVRPASSSAAAGEPEPKPEEANEPEAAESEPKPSRRQRRVRSSEK